jgi:hypothetical protein
MNARLEVGEVSESAHITAEAPRLQTETPEGWAPSCTVKKTSSASD